MNEFIAFPKIPRYSRDCIVTEKIDGTNGQICITPEGEFLVGSRSRWITPEHDNHGFAKWAYANKEELLKFGPSLNFGEWWGQGINRGYGLKEKRFSLFNVTRWSEREFNIYKISAWEREGSKEPRPVFKPPPACCGVVPVIARGIFGGEVVETALRVLGAAGSYAAPGFMKPEGIVIYHTAGNTLFKKTLERDDEWKGKEI